MLHHVCKETVFSLILKLSKQDHTATFRERAIERRVFQVWGTEDQEGAQKKKAHQKYPQDLPERYMSTITLLSPSL